MSNVVSLFPNAPILISAGEKAPTRKQVRRRKRLESLAAAAYHVGNAYVATGAATDRKPLCVVGYAIAALASASEDDEVIDPARLKVIALNLMRAIDVARSEARARASQRAGGAQ